MLIEHLLSFSIILYQPLSTRVAHKASVIVFHCAHARRLVSIYFFMMFKKNKIDLKINVRMIFFLRGGKKKKKQPQQTYS